MNPHTIKDMKVDYTCYLVTDSGMVPVGISFADQVERAITSGVTLVQLREKNLETREFVRRAELVHELTKKANIPLIINDRVDVALAVDAEGVHVGQDDMPVEIVRKLIGPDKILGLSVSYEHEMVDAIGKKHLIDYVGIGALFPTSTKALKKIPFGPSGLRRILTIMRDEGGADIPCVAIGGLDQTNVQKVLYTSAIPGKSVDGVAVVSCIMAQKDCKSATESLVDLIQNPGPWFCKVAQKPELSAVLEAITQYTPMIHHITNDVVKNFSANVTLAVGGSPIMSECAEEFSEFAQIPHSALLLNTGTPTEPQVQMFLHAAKCYNATGRPIVYDPVGGGASKVRRETLARLLNQAYFSVIKGNVGEIYAAAGIDMKMRGVDNISTTDLDDVIQVAKKLALETRSVVVVTGERDVVVDGVNNGSNCIPKHYCQRLSVVHGGHKVMGSITGSGCSLGSVIAVFVSAMQQDPFIATLAAISAYKRAGELAAVGNENKPGSFMIAFLDSLKKVVSEASFELPKWSDAKQCV